MTSFDSDASAFRRTSQEAARRGLSERLTPEGFIGILPIFWSDSFSFDDGEEPAHINKFPTKDEYLSLFEVHGGSEPDRTYALAVDVPSFSMASLLVSARVRKLEETRSKHGYTEDIWIKHPDARFQRAHTGELNDD